MRAKRWLALFLIFAMAVGLAVIPVAAESVLEGSGSLQNNTVTFSVGANPDTVVYTGAPVNIPFTVSLSSDSNQLVDAFSFVLAPSSNLFLAKEEYSEQNSEFYYQLVLGDVTDVYSILKETYGEYDFVVNEGGTRYYFGAAKKSGTGREFTDGIAVLNIVGRVNAPGKYTLGLVTTGNDAVVAGQVTGSGDNTTSSYFRRIVNPATVEVVAGGVISGTVVDDKGNAVSGATVTLKNGDNTVATAETDANGVYTLPAVVNGAYTLDVTAQVEEKTLRGSKSVTVNQYAVDAGSITVQEYQKGDVNKNGKVDILDVERLFEHVQGKNPLDATGLSLADVNANGKVDILDVERLFEHVQGKNLLG